MSQRTPPPIDFGEILHVDTSKYDPEFEDYDYELAGAYELTEEAFLWVDAAFSIRLHVAPVIVASWWNGQQLPNDLLVSKLTQFPMKDVLTARQFIVSIPEDIRSDVVDVIVKLYRLERGRVRPEK